MKTLLILAAILSASAAAAAPVYTIAAFNVNDTLGQFEATFSAKDFNMDGYLTEDEVVPTPGVTNFNGSFVSYPTSPVLTGFGSEIDFTFSYFIPMPRFEEISITGATSLGVNPNPGTYTWDGVEARLAFGGSDYFGGPEFVGAQVIAVTNVPIPAPAALLVGGLAALRARRLISG